MEVGEAEIQTNLENAAAIGAKSFFTAIPTPSSFSLWKMSHDDGRREPSFHEQNGSRTQNVHAWDRRNLISQMSSVHLATTSTCRGHS